MTLFLLVFRCCLVDLVILSHDLMNVLWHFPDVYLCTYPSDTSVELMKSYNPKKALFIPYENSDARLTYKRTLELLLDVDFDLAITTRYDIKFNQNYPVYNFSFNSEKVNLAFKEKGWWEANRYTADPQNFCIFPKKYLLIKII